MSDENLDDLEQEANADLERESDDSDGAEESKNNESKKDDRDLLEKRHKDLEKYKSKLEQENKELRENLAKLNGKVEAIIGQRSTSQAEPDDKSWLEKEDWEAKLSESPVESTMSMIKLLREEVARTLEARDRFFQEKLQDFDPEVYSLKEKISSLESDPDYDGFSRKQLAIIAKKQISTKQTKQEKPDEEIIDEAMVSSSRGGKRMPTQKSKEDPLVNEFMKRIGYDKLDRE